MVDRIAEVQTRANHDEEEPMISNETGEEGLVYRCQEGTDRAVAAGSRTAITDDGSIICTFVVQTQLGSNDFKPMVCWSEDGGQTWRDHRMIWPDLADR